METLVVDINDAKSHFDELMGQVEHGVSVVLNKGGDAVARILPAGKRVPGLNAGAITVAEDFDLPLPDSFWLGEK